jgi:precorrin-6B methylase 2
MSHSSLESTHSARWFVLLAAVAVTAAAVVAGHAFARPLDVPYVPTPEPVVNKMLELAQVKSDDYLIDLGSGDGRIPIAAAKTYGVRAMGVDIDPVRIQEAKANAEKAKVTDKVEFVEQDLFKTDLSKATVITMYLLERINLKLRPELQKLKPGTRIVSHSFSMGDWLPHKKEVVDGRSVYLWIVGENTIQTQAPGDGTSAN